ncbi:MAG: helix-turn-helix domain-containing protein [Thermodesulfobacteriota bacterium]
MLQTLTLKQAAVLAGVSAPTLRRWVHLGLVPVHRRTPTGRVLFERHAVEQWLAEMTVNPEPQRAAK